MVNTDDIFQAEEAEQAGKNSGDKALDEVMLAMDVVDTARHEDRLLDPELSGAERQHALLDRLRAIYDAQGIDVSEKILLNGVLALEEQRFDFQPPQPSFALSLAKIYIHRNRWLPLFSIFISVIFGAWLINHYAFVRPAQLEAQKVETLLTETLPQRINSDRDRALSIAATDEVRSRILGVHSLAETALQDKDVKEARKYSQELTDLGADISANYKLRVVNRPDEYSGIFSVPDENQSIRNYYLIVEAINPSGETIRVFITSEEHNNTQRTNIWGVRVPYEEFQKIADDKQDDMIIQNNIIGEKKRGYLEPEYSIETSGGKILEW